MEGTNLIVVKSFVSLRIVLLAEILWNENFGYGVGQLLSVYYVQLTIQL